MTNGHRLDRRAFLQLSAGVVLAGATTAGLTPARAAAPIKVGALVADSGPAALFGAAQRQAAELGVSVLNANGGILGRPVELVFADAGASPAEVAKSVIRLLLSDKIELLLGSHDSAVRLAVEGAVKGKVPYFYTPVFEGQDCAANTYYLGETPEQQLQKSLPTLVEIAKGKTFYLIGNDYVWARTTNEIAKKYIADLGGTVVGEDYYPFAAGNNFDSSTSKIKSVKPAIVLETLVGGDNVNFNRTFSDFGIADGITRMSCLLEENTLAGIGAQASKNLYSSLGYFADLDTPANKSFIEALKTKFGDKLAQQCTIAQGLYNACVLIGAASAKAKSIDPKAFGAAADGLTFDTPSGPMTVKHRHTDKNMFLARCDGGKFKVIKTFDSIATQQKC